MAETIKFAKVNTLPATFAGSTIYVVKDADADFAQFYISNSAGSAVRRLPNKADIQAMVNAAVGGTSHIHVVADIAARNALAPTVVTQALVIDATADPTVNAGAATYIFNPADSQWSKIAEYESMDVILQWSSLQGKPTSAVADIDDAVAKRHAHSNLPTLEKLSDPAGDLLYNGNYVDPVLRATDW